MKYRVHIPPPKAKRMLGSGKIIIQYSEGWHALPSKEILIGSEITEYTFTVPDDVPYIYNNRVNDGPWFNVLIEYTNKDGTRKETIRPVPECLK